MYIQVHSGTFWYFQVLSGTFWYFLVRLGTFRYVLVLLGTFLYFQVLSDTFLYFHVLSDTFRYFQEFLGTFWYFLVLSGTFWYYRLILILFRVLPARLQSEVYFFNVQVTLCAQKSEDEARENKQTLSHAFEKSEAKVSHSEDTKQWRHVHPKLPDKITIPDCRVIRHWHKGTLGVDIKKVNCEDESRLKQGAKLTHTQVIESPRKPPLCSETLPKLPLNTPKLSLDSATAG